MNEASITHKFTIDRKRTAEELLRETGPYTTLLAETVDQAKRIKASDIHIEPTVQGIDIRLRVNGELELFRQATEEHRESLIFEAKRLFGLAIGVSGKPQDGRVSLPSISLDMRVSLIPTFYGEKIVMRLLDLETNFDLEDLRFSEAELGVFEKATAFDEGLVVISGPTGSGKTRTLYSVLRSLDHRQMNIVTIEDPIEYRLHGINQVQTSDRLSFADALRSMLRQDPDVIFVGEVRDRETAALCFQAASTGHLVFTTVHANGAIEVVDRFRNLGIDELDLKSCLKLSIAQRLCQELCSHCAVESKTKTGRKRNHQGCEHCHAGIIGRLPISEWAKCESDFALEQSLASSKASLARIGRIEESEET